LLEQVARRGSWMGGGSAAAFSAALAAALLEKLMPNPRRARRLRGVRRDCLRLMRRDADAFARVIQMTRQQSPGAFRRSLKTAIEVPALVCEHAQTIQATCRAAQRSVGPRFQSDLRCAMAIALAAGEAARTLVETNLAWLDEPAYTRRIRRRLQAAARSHARSRLR